MAGGIIMIYKRIRFLGLTSKVKDMIHLGHSHTIIGSFPSYQFANHITAFRDKIIIYDF